MRTPILLTPHCSFEDGIYCSAIEGQGGCVFYFDLQQPTPSLVVPLSRASLSAYYPTDRTISETPLGGSEASQLHNVAIFSLLPRIYCFHSRTSCFCWYERNLVECNLRGRHQPGWTLPPTRRRRQWHLAVRPAPHSSPQFSEIVLMVLC